jgi:hypothetical protein
MKLKDMKLRQLNFILLENNCPALYLLKPGILIKISFYILADTNNDLILQDYFLHP